MRKRERENTHNAAWSNEICRAEVVTGPAKDEIKAVKCSEETSKNLLQLRKKRPALRILLVLCSRRANIYIV